MNLRALAATLAALTTGLALAAGPLANATAAASGTTATTTATTTAKAKPTSYAVTLTTTNAQPVAGRTYSLKGAVKPAAPQQKVVLQKRFGESGRWKTEATTKLGKKSKFTFKIEASSAPGLRQFRVVKAAQGKRAKGHSPAVAVTYFAWHRVVDMDSRADDALGEGSATIVGERLPESLVGWLDATTGQRDYNINRDCTRLRATLGAGDDSEESATATITVVADGVNRFQRTFALTQSAPVSLPLTGVFRLGFAYDVANPEATDPARPTGAVAVIGTPEALCSF